jgi:hypothetical protein
MGNAKSLSGFDMHRVSVKLAATVLITVAAAMFTSGCGTRCFVTSETPAQAAWPSARPGPATMLSDTDLASGPPKGYRLIGEMEMVEPYSDWDGMQLKRDPQTVAAAWAKFAKEAAERGADAFIPSRVVRYREGQNVAMIPETTYRYDQNGEYRRDTVVKAVSTGYNGQGYPWGYMHGQLLRKE